MNLYTFLPTRLCYFLAALCLTASCLSSNKSEQKTETKTTPVKTSEKKNPTSCQIDDDCVSYFRCITTKCTNPPAISGVLTSTTPTAIIKKADGSSETFNLELAVSIKEMTRGLMYRKTMREDWGMLFIYDDVRVRSFWMKNTLIALDMLFIDKKGRVVGIVEGAEPMTRQARTVNIPAKYVLELIAGRSKNLGIKAGDIVTLTNVEAWQDVEK